MYRLPGMILRTTVLVVALAAMRLPLAAEEPATEAAGDAKESVDVRYARAYLELARTDLQIVLEANKKVPGTYRDAAIAPLRQVVAIAEAQLQYALSKDARSLQNIHIRQAQAAVAEAETDLQRSLAANEKLPGLLTPEELRRARLQVQVAELGLARARAADAEDPLQYMQWQLAELRKRLLQLRSQVKTITMQR